MKAEKILLIRHGEKPPVPPAPPPPFGVDEDGNVDDKSLIVRGWQRAGALVPFFATPTRPGVAVPSIIYTARPDPIDAPAVGNIPSVHRSKRPRQTVTALAARLKVEMVDSFAVGEEEQLVADLAERDGVVLICWEHRHVPQLARMICGSAPDSWDAERFDVVWVFDRAGDGYTFTMLDQGLLAGDR